MRLLDAARARLALLFGRRTAESRMDEEMRFHIEMEADRLVREKGLSAAEAVRQARLAFGGAEKYREELRDGRGLAWLGGLSLDFKLGLRMLVKYPGLTLVGGLAMAFAVWVGTVAFVVHGQVFNPTLPLPGGERIVQIENWDVSANSEQPPSLSDFLAWRDVIQSVTDFGAYRNVTHNLIVGNEAGPPVSSAEITASAFRIAPEPPLLGRVLAPADEEAGAAPVVLIGYDVWETRFASDPGVIGRTVQLGTTYATVVGVMPEGFGFPTSHGMWTPLRPEAIAHGLGEGIPVEVFGRLSPGVTLERAQAELTTIGRPAPTERLETQEHLRPHVAPYAGGISGDSPGDLIIPTLIALFPVLLLILICSNVALLLFARAATRETELVTRSALGASRGRIVAQLFVEALVLGAVAAAFGLTAAGFALRHWGVEFLERNMGPLPFWFDISLSPATVLYALALTALGSAIAGMMPALKVTRGLGARLRQGTAGGGGLRFGGVWTAVIVTQVAVTVAIPLVVYVEQRELVRVQSQDAGYPDEEYLAVQLEMDETAVPGGDAESAAATQRVVFGAALEELRRRVASEAGVAGVTFVDRLPRDYHRGRWVELDDETGIAGQGGPITAAAPPAGEVSLASIDPSYFEVLESPILTGRVFTAADLSPDARTVIVDQAFVEMIMGGRNPIGRRVRIADGIQPIASDVESSRSWYEIVGVAEELGMTPFNTRQRAAGLYLPAAPGSVEPVQMLVHVRGDPISLARRVREIATAVDPTLRLATVQRADEVTNDVLWILGLWLRITVALTAVALLLSLAGIYAVLSFTVARRTREIGVRVALGAPRGRIVAAIFRRPLTQVGAGIATGFILVTAVAGLMTGHVPDQPIEWRGLSLGQVSLLASYATVMLGVCLLACVVPTQRALGVQPSESLRAE
ncbi:MAG: ABC transporter permease [Gemmatimonadota bacterium]